MTESREVTVTEGIVRFQARYVRNLNDKLALNEFGLPTGFWATDRVLNALQTESDEPPDDAWIQLDYAGGFPTVGHSAVPFWDRLPNEPDHYFGYLRSYLQQEGARNIQVVALEVNQSPAFLQSLFDLYYWGFRAKAFDLFHAASSERFRAIKGRLIEDEHFAAATALFERAKEWLENAQNFGKLSGREVIEVFKLAVQLQRMSLHLPINGVKSGSEANGIRDSRAIMYDLAQHSHLHLHDDSSAQMLAKALSSPEAASLAQKLALEIRKPGQLPGPKVINALPTEPTDGTESADGTEPELDDIADDILSGGRL